ncbi:regulatory protein (EAL domain) [Legionella beliardensis]|uniref:Regulatory protein (EAL domain) n=1 Tax=Legionella beliardensis TaxID=91822 RepID=A0A378I2G2_9GAMM|nr:EAL domain-containing protein [Legionella beliardensis]STX28930.1 regulatory protein (EAL domain) [Legionella beliardensis]
MAKQAPTEDLRLKFSTVWAIATILLICLVNFYQGWHLKYQKESHLQLQASHLGYKLDHFIDTIVKPLDLLPLTQEQLKNCQHLLLPKLQALVFNSPIITGIVIYNAKTNFICTTFDPQAPLPNPYISQQILLGPMKTTQVNNEFFLLQRPYQDIYIGIYILKSTLETFLLDDLDHTTMALYDMQKKQIILDSNISTTSDKQLYPMTLNNLTNLNKNTLILPLDSLKNIKLIVQADSFNFYKNLIVQLLLISLPLLFLSWLLHNYFQQIMNKRFSITAALNNALKMHQFFPSYQPILCPKTKTFCGAEILIRWINDENELIMPDYFIDDAERSDLIVPITLQLVEKTLAECAEFLHKNPSFHLGFNIAPSHFKSETFFEDFDNLCKYNAIFPKQIMLELTERELFNNVEQRIKIKMAELRNKGYLLAIDDFGTGHASISYLQHFPFNFLKIDKLFIQSIGTGAITEALNEAIISIANSLKLKIIAEGVETQEQFDYLIAKKVDFIQGWFIAKAMNFNQLQELILSKRKKHE